ncbi:MAG: hypothetical protein L6R19_28190 [Alphaproteobacteria bacterium]|nr:hypothetical protein [Alphaproteobacteria bacterium]
MLRYALSLALLTATIGVAQAESIGQETNSGTASMLQLELRQCNRIDDGAQRETCKAQAWAKRGYSTQLPTLTQTPYERSVN